VERSREILLALKIDWITVHYLTRLAVDAGASGRTVQIGVPIADYANRYRDDLQVYRGTISPYIRFFVSEAHPEMAARLVLLGDSPQRPAALGPEWYYLGGPLVGEFVRITGGKESQGEATQADVESMCLRDAEGLRSLVRKLSDWTGEKTLLPEARAIGVFRDACRVTFLALGLNDPRLTLPRVVILCPIYVEENLVGGMAFVGTAAIDLLAVSALRTYAYNLLSGLRLVEDEEREKQIAQVRATDTLRGEVVQRMLHSIHNPIEALSSVVRDALKNLDMLAELATRFRAVETSLGGLQQSAQDLVIAFARDDVADLLVARPTRLDLGDFLDTLTVMHSKLFEEQKKQLVLGEIPSDAVAYADKTAVWEVLCNLVTNALRHARKTVTVSVGMNEARDKVLIRIRDDGEGIDPLVRKRLFQPGASTSDGPGHGFGLYVGKLLMSRQGGDLYWNENSTNGTEFVVEVAAFRPSGAEKRQ
jgi:signal transduction histidine kinase